MMPLAYDFKDIASRMKGELKQEPVVELVPLTPAASWKDKPAFCTMCNGSGKDHKHGGLCQYCLGRGVIP